MRNVGADSLLSIVGSPDTQHDDFLGRRRGATTPQNEASQRKTGSPLVACPYTATSPILFAIWVTLGGHGTFWGAVCCVTRYMMRCGCGCPALPRRLDV